MVRSNVSGGSDERLSSSSSARTSSTLSTSSPRKLVPIAATKPPSITSRLSSSTSSLTSLATSESDKKSDEEPLFRSRWSDEMEMDKSLKILKQKHSASVRLRKMNDVYDRLLESKLRLLDAKLFNTTKELTKETRFIREEIDELQPSLKFPRIQSNTTSSYSSRQSSCLDGSRSQTEDVCQSCLFDATNRTGRCRHFPCFLPVTYNSIGEFPKPQTYSVVKNYKQLLRRCVDLRPPTSKRKKDIEEKSDVIDDDEPHSPRITVKEKIRGLKQLVKEMKERNDKTKPRAWATNYGDPVPRRMILKPVKAS